MIHSASVSCFRLVLSPKQLSELSKVLSVRQVKNTFSGPSRPSPSKKSVAQVDVGSLDDDKLGIGGRKLTLKCFHAIEKDSDLL